MKTEARQKDYLEPLNNMESEPKIITLNIKQLKSISKQNAWKHW